jgi:polyferredoxin
MKKPPLQRWRALTQIGFFALFTLTPIFDLLRYDLTAGHAYFLTMQWRLGLDELLAGHGSAGSAAANLLLYLFLPLLAAALLVIGVAWKWGRLYCGWLCPHFSVVETINRLMLFATGKHSLWDRYQTPPWQPDGSPLPRDRRYWLVVVPAAIAFAFTWAVVFLTYLMPPLGVYHGLVTATLSRNEVIFLSAATMVLSLEFLFARHLFCRYGCAVGLFQSLVWMANRRAMVIGFNARRAHDCVGCESACDNACPMRLTPRAIKRRMFTCDNCGACVDACTTVQGAHGRASLLQYVSGDCALDKSERDFGYRPSVPSNCFDERHKSERRVIPIHIIKVASSE